MIELSLMKCLLKTLVLVGDIGLRESVLMDEITLVAVHRPTGDQIREHLRDAESRKLIVSHAGFIGEKRWQITTRGHAVYKEIA